MLKNCGKCKKEYKRNPKYSNQQWIESKFCSRECQYVGKDMTNFVSPLKGKKSPYCGSKHHLWKGGVTNKHEGIRKSAKYTEWRTQVFERDDYTCKECNKRGGDLQADHIKPFAYFIELRFELDNGRTLCKPCHYKTPTFGEKAKKYAKI